MPARMIIAMLLAVSLFTACAQDEKLGSSEVLEAPSSTAPEEVPLHYTIDVSAKPVSDYMVEFTVNTNIPLPVEVMASIALKDQRPDETYIGNSERVRLTSSEQTFVIDSSQKNPLQPKLPAGDYMAEVTFYPRWGAENGNPKAKAVKEDISDSTEIRLAGSGESVSDAQARNESRNWVFENVIMGTPWDEQVFVQQLGKYEKITADRNLHEGFYFPKVDMTMIVNTYKKEVSIWRIGRASK